MSRLLAALQVVKSPIVAGRDAIGPVVVLVMDRDRVADYQRMVAELRGVGLADGVARIVERAGARGVVVATPRWTRAANERAAGASARDEASQQREVIGDGDLSMTVRGAGDWIEALLHDRILRTLDENARQQV